MAIVVVPDILESVVNAMVVPGVDSINFQIGRLEDVIQEQIEMGNSISLKDKVFPMVSVEFPITEISNASTSNFIIMIRKIVISTITNFTDDVKTRYKPDGAYKTILYPMFYEFLNQLAKNPALINSDITTFKYNKMDVPAIGAIIERSNDYVDSIVISNIELQIPKQATQGNTGSNTSSGGSNSSSVGGSTAVIVPDSPLTSGCS